MATKKVIEKIYVHLNKRDYAACEEKVKKEDRKHHSLTKRKNMVSCPDCQKLL